jgi:hypothetical protein
MWAWLLGTYAVFFVLVGGAAAGVALFVEGDNQRGERAVRVLKLALGTGTGIAGLIALAVKLHDAGLL